jgi:hypothetical protein
LEDAYEGQGKVEKQEELAERRGASILHVADKTRSFKFDLL